jgi:DNA-binding response OmpR family regulator
MPDSDSVGDGRYSHHQMLAERSEQTLDPAGPGVRTSDRLHVALIDRDSGFTQVLQRRLQMRSYQHRVIRSPVTPEALVRMRLSALVVDISILGPDCWEYLERVCSRLPRLAVIVCTGSTSVAQRVRGLRLGVDAWVTKPCHPEELICVIEAVLRRYRRSELADLAAPSEAGELIIRPDLHQAYVGQRSVELTAREFEILQLLSQTDRVLRREEIYERVWGYAMAHGDRSVDVFVRKLRQKLRAASPAWDYIHTHFGVGYRFAPAPDLDVAVGPEPAVTRGAEPGSLAPAPVNP